VYPEHGHHPEGPLHQRDPLHEAAADLQKVVQDQVDRAGVVQKESRELGRNLICEK